MTSWLVVRERLKIIYSEYSKWIDASLRFAFAFFALTVINFRMGYVEALDSVLAIILLSLVCAVLPVGISFVVACVFIIMNLLQISTLLSLVFAGIGLLMYLLYFSFKPGNAYAATLGLSLGLLGCYAPLPMILGLLASPITFIPAFFGMFTSAFVGYIDANYAMLVVPDHTSNDIKQTITVIKGVASDEELWSALCIVFAVLLVVYFIRRIFFKNNWMVAILSGTFLYLLLVLLFSFEWGIKAGMLPVLINVFLALLSGFVLRFFNYMVDAARVERVQFEDDDYYYYVKVVPKVRVSIPEVHITKINSRKVKDEVKTSEQVVFVEKTEAGEEASEPAGQGEEE